MNREGKRGGLDGFFKGLDGRVKDGLLLVSLAVILLLSAWQIFHTEEGQSVSSQGVSEEELKVMRLLEEMEGVGDANVFVYTDDNSKKNVVIVCEGANNLRVIMQVREAVAAALGTEEKAVKIYLKKE